MMKITGTEIIDLFKKSLAIEWGSCSSFRDKEQLKFPPTMVWRFDPKKMSSEQIKNAEGRIIAAVKDFKGNVEWSIYFGGRNWVLMPTRVKEFHDEGKYRVDVEADLDFAEQYPDFSLKAIQDLPELAKQIGSFLSPFDEEKLNDKESKK